MKSLLLLCVVFLGTATALPNGCPSAPEVVPSTSCRWESVTGTDSTACPTFKLKCDVSVDMACYEIPDTGNCRRRAGRIPLYAFDVYRKRCQRIRFGACLGLKNMFVRREDCEKRCHKTDEVEVRPTEILACSTVKCGRCRRCVANNLSEAKCVMRDGCLSCGTESVVNCLIDPCMNWQQRCPGASRCVTNYCGGCNAFYYDKQWNELNEQQCRGAESACNLVDCKPGYRCSVLSGNAVCVREQSDGTERTKLEMCSAFPETGRCRGAFNRYYYDRVAGQCRLFSYGGCGGNANNFHTIAECRSSCAGVAQCPLPGLARPPPGCRYDRKLDPESLCPTYVLNCDDTVSQSVLKRCSEEEDAGPCKALMHRWRYDRTRGACVQFNYGGCQGNKNNFVSADECRRVCGKVPQCPIPGMVARPGCKLVVKQNPVTYCPDYKLDCSSNDDRLKRCSLPAIAGPCEALFERYHYDRTSGRCKRFNYGGCQGNANNFVTEKECQNTCSGVPGCPIPKMVSRPGCKVVTRQGDDGCPIYEFDCSNPCSSNPCNRCERCVLTKFRSSGYQCLGDQRCENGNPVSCAAVLCLTGTVCKVVGGSARCVPADKLPALCRLPKVVGRCRASMRRYFFNSVTKRCERFIYGGCGGNANRFDTEVECERACPMSTGGSSRPGQCPRLPPGTAGICVERCSADNDCAQGQKCCSNGCGHVCMRALHRES